MNQQEIAHFAERYFTLTNCQIIEKSPNFITVKLSPEADKALTNRHYYWGFIERTGAEPETMSFTFRFCPEEIPHTKERQEYLSYGSARLEQIFNTVKNTGRFTNLYEQPVLTDAQRYPTSSLAYSTWLHVNYLVALECDMRRDEIHSLGISMLTGEIVPNFFERVQTRSLSPKLPANTHLRQTISLPRALSDLEKHIERVVQTYDHQWAADAHERLQEELARIDAFYEDLRATTKDEEQEIVANQHEARRAEVEWQHRPRIRASVVNCGFFHLLSAP